MGASKNLLKPCWRRWNASQNAHLLQSKLRFFESFRLAIINLIKFLEAP